MANVLDPEEEKKKQSTDNEYENLFRDMHQTLSANDPTIEKDYDAFKQSLQDKDTYDSMYGAYKYHKGQQYLKDYDKPLRSMHQSLRQKHQDVPENYDTFAQDMLDENKAKVYNQMRDDDYKQYVKDNIFNMYPVMLKQDSTIPDIDEVERQMGSDVDANKKYTDLYNAGIKKLNEQSNLDQQQRMAEYSRYNDDVVNYNNALQQRQNILKQAEGYDPERGWKFTAYDQTSGKRFKDYIYTKDGQHWFTQDGREMLDEDGYSQRIHQYTELENAEADVKSMYNSLLAVYKSQGGEAARQFLHEHLPHYQNTKTVLDDKGKKHTAGKGQFYTVNQDAYEDAAWNYFMNTDDVKDSNLNANLQSLDKDIEQFAQKWVGSGMGYNEERQNDMDLQQSIMYYADHARSYMESANSEKDNINGATHVARSAWNGLADGLNDKAKWDFGITDFQNGKRLYDAINAINSGKASKGQQLLVNSYLLYGASQSAAARNGGIAYGTMNTTAVSIPFMLQMCLSPELKVFNGGTMKVASSVLQFLTKKFGASKVARYIARMGNAASRSKLAAVAEKLWGKIPSAVSERAIPLAKSIGKGAEHLADSAAAGAYQTIKMNSLNVAADAYDRMTGKIETKADDLGNITYKTDEKGNIERTGVEEGGWQVAIPKAFGNYTIQNGSECIGEYLAPFMNAIVSKGGKAIGADILKSKAKDLWGIKQVSAFLDNVCQSGTARKVKLFQNYAHWDGNLGEYGEEVVGNVASALFGVDGNFKLDRNSLLGDDEEAQQSVFNLQKNLDTYLGVAVMGAIFQGYAAGGYMKHVANRRKWEMNLGNADREGYFCFGDWESMKKTIDSRIESGQGYADLITDNLKRGGSEDQRKAIQNYAVAKSATMNIAKLEDALTNDPESDASEAKVTQAHSNGYSLKTPVDLNDAQNSVNAAEVAMNKAVNVPEGKNGDETIGLNADASNAADVLRDVTNSSDYTDDQKTAIENYVNARVNYQGVLDRGADDVQTAVEASNRYIDKITNEKGQVQSVTTKDNGTVYLVRGNVTTGNDGIAISSQTDPFLIVYNPATGQTTHMSGSDVLYVGSAEDAAQMKEQQAERARVMEGMKRVNAINGKLSFVANDTYNLTDAQGQPMTVKVLQDVGDGTIIAEVNGQQQQVAKADIQQMYTNQQQQKLNDHMATMAETRRQQAQAAAEANGEEAAPTATDKIPTDENGKHLYEQAPVSDTFDSIAEQLGSEIAAVDFANMKAKQAEENQKAVNKAAEDAVKAADPTDADAQMEIAKQQEAAKKAAQVAADYWKAVANEPKARAERAKVEAQKRAEEAKNNPAPQQTETEQVKAGVVDNTGFSIEKAMPDLYNTAQAFANGLGMQIEFVPADPVHNGVNIGKKITVALDATQITPERTSQLVDDLVMAALGHEVTHTIFRNADMKARFVPLVKQYLGRGYDIIFAQQKRLYEAEKTNGNVREEISDDYIDEEIAANMAGQLLQDAEFRNLLINDGKVEGDTSLLDTIINKINKWLDIIGLHIPNTRQEIYKQMQAEWLDAFQTTQTAVQDKTVKYVGQDKASLRTEEAPKNTKTAYAVYVIKKGKDGKTTMHPKMIKGDSAGEVPLVWQNADTGYLKRDENGNPIENKRGRGMVSVNGTMSGGAKGNKLAWRAGKHMAYYPNASQFASTKDGMMDNNVVFFEVEYAADKDYQLDAWSYGMRPDGRYQNDWGGLPYIPKDGYYIYRTNDIADGATPMVITGAYRIKRALTDAEAKAINQENGGKWIERRGGELTEDGLRELGVAPEQLEEMRDNYPYDQMPEPHDESADAMKMSGYVQYPINFDDPTLQHAAEENGQDLNEYRKQYEEKLKADAEKKAIADEVFAETVDADVENMMEGNGGVTFNSKGEMVAEANQGETPKFSIKTWEDGGRAALETYLNKQIKKKVITKDEAANMLAEMDRLTGMAKDLAKGNPEGLFGKWSYEVVRQIDGTGVPVMHALKKNSEYSLNIDFSTVCKKRQVIDHLMNRMINEGYLQHENLSATDIARMNQIIQKHGLEIACAICFVDSKRYNAYVFANGFLDKFNPIIQSLMPDAEVAGFNYSNDNEFSNEGKADLTKENEVVDWGKVFTSKGDNLDALADYNLDWNGVYEILKPIYEKAREDMKANDFEDKFKSAWCKEHEDTMKPYVQEQMLKKGEKVTKSKITNGMMAEFYKKAIKDGALPEPTVEDRYAYAARNARNDGNAEQKFAYAVSQTPELRKLAKAEDFIASEGWVNVMQYNPALETLWNIQKGAAGARANESNVQYQSDVLNKTVTGDIFDIGGYRMQSFSDFIGRMYFDYLQAFADLAAKQLPAHAYTKEPSFVKLFGKMGMKINMSLVSQVDSSLPKEYAGLTKDANGNLTYNFNVTVKDSEGNIIQQGQTFPPEEAFALQANPEYTKNVGTIAVGLSREHIKMLLRDPRIRMVIPYHKSGLPHGVAIIYNINEINDYTDQQNTTGKDPETGMPVSLSKDDKAIMHKRVDQYNFMLHQLSIAENRNAAYNALRKLFIEGDASEGDMHKKYDALYDGIVNGTITEGLVDYQLSDKHGDEGFLPKVAADIYLEACDNYNYTPRFSEFADEYDYYKVLEDFAVYDNEGNYTPQEAVHFEVPENVEDYIKETLAEDEDITDKERQETDSIVTEMKNYLDNRTLRDEQDRIAGKAAADVTDEERAFLGQNLYNVGDPRVGARLSIKGEIGADETERQNLEVAKQMQQAGKSPKEIKMATGWEVGADGKWKVEAEDFPYPARENNPTTLGEAYPEDHPLFKAYPQLKDIKLDYSRRTSTAGAYSPLGNSITISKEIWNDDYGKNYLRSVIQHEIQHAIQRIEGFAAGTSQTKERDAYMAKVEKEQPAAYALYSLFGGMLPWSKMKKLTKQHVISLTKRGIEGGGRTERINTLAKTLLDAAEPMTNEEFAQLMNAAANIDRAANKAGKEGYKDSAGEVEANNVETRLGWSDEKRRNTTLEETEDVPRRKQVAKFSLKKKTPEEFDAIKQKAIDNIGYVPEGIENAIVKVTPLEHHPFTGSGKQAIEKARTWAKEHIVGIHIANEGTSEEYRYEIPEEAIGKYLSSSSTGNSTNLGLHLAALMKLPEIIENSIDAEIHPDYKKVNKTRSAANGIDNEDLLVHRLYGAALMDGDTYRVKNTIKESKGEEGSSYDYQILKVELPISGSSTSNALGNSTFISGANLLNNVEKSYDEGKLILPKKKKNSISANSGLQNGSVSEPFNEEPEPLDRVVTPYSIKDVQEWKENKPSTEGNARLEIYEDADLNKQRQMIHAVQKTFGGKINDASNGAFQSEEGVKGTANAGKAYVISSGMDVALKTYRRLLEAKRDAGSQSKTRLTVYNDAIADVDKAIKWYDEFGRGQHNKLGDHDEAGIKFSIKQQEQQESPAFKAWFGDWQNDPEHASNIRYSVKSAPKVDTLGAPYTGSKNAIGKDIINILPAGKRFVDLFAGGGAMTHAAMLSGKYDEYHMNDKFPAGIQLFLDGIDGKYEGYNKKVSKEDFFNGIAGTPEGLLWSHMNNNRSYQGDRGEQRAKRVNRLQALKEYRDKISTSAEDYRDYPIQDGDVLYADIPYEDTDVSAYRNAGAFDVQAFYDWAKNLGQPVYISIGQDVKDGGIKTPEGFTTLWEGQVKNGNKLRNEVVIVADKFGKQERERIKKETPDADGVRYSVKLSNDTRDELSRIVNQYDEGEDEEGRTYSGSDFVDDIKFLYDDASSDDREILEPIMDRYERDYDLYMDSGKRDDDGIDRLVENARSLANENGARYSAKDGYTVNENPFVWNRKKKALANIFRNNTLDEIGDDVVEYLEKSTNLFEGLLGNDDDVLAYINTMPENEYEKMTRTFKDIYVPSYSEFHKMDTNEQSDYLDDIVLKAKGVREKNLESTDWLEKNAPELISAVTFNNGDGSRISAEQIRKMYGWGDEVSIDDMSAEIDTDKLNSGARYSVKDNNAPYTTAASYAAYETAKGLNVPINQITDVNDIPADLGKNVKGWYDPKTGQVNVVIPNCSSVNDAKKTVLHECVAHFGLRNLLGQQKLNDFISDLYVYGTPELREEVNKRLPENGWHYGKATEEYLGRVAEGEDIKQSLWDQIKNAIKNLLRGMGVNVALNDNDVKYMLWKSKHTLENGDIFDRAQDIAKQAELGVGNYARYSLKAGTFQSDMARMQYERAMESGMLKFREAWQDSMISLRELQDAIAKETGTPITPFENAYLAENRMHGTGKNEAEWYDMNFYTPMLQAVADLQKAFGDRKLSLEDVDKYMMAKHGVERNVFFAFKQGLDELQKKIEEAEFNAMMAKARQQTTDPKKLAKAEAQARKDAQEKAQKLRESVWQQQKTDANVIAKKQDYRDGKITYAEYMNAVKAAMVQRCKETQKYLDQNKDFSGLKAVTGEDDDFEAAAYQMVDSIERPQGQNVLDKVNNMWDKVNAATKETINKSRQSGLMTEKAYNYVNSMFDFYVPLRGWSETTADEVYDYMTSQRSAFSPALKKMKGRTREADSPLATIGNMATSTIITGNQNLMKQHFLRMVQNHPTSLATVSEQWYEKVTTSQGEKWIARTPNITEGMTADQISQEVQNFNAQMQQLKANGDATNVRGHFSIEYPAIEQQKKEHQVHVSIDGKEYVIYVNGNPKAAQALNGINKVQNSYWGREAIAKVNRFVSAKLTSQNPAFIFSNLCRDMLAAQTQILVKESPKYIGKFELNAAQVLGTAMMPRLLKKWEKGTLNPNDKWEGQFLKFMKNGGETGFVAMLSVDSFKDEMAKKIKKFNGHSSAAMNAWDAAWDMVEFYNRAIEDVTRFVTFATSMDMGKSLEDSIYDAKVISLNFDKKGTGGKGNALMRDLYIFANPAIQALQNMCHLIANHPVRFSAVALAYIGRGIMQSVWNTAMINWAGDDDDEDTYWAIPQWVRRNNLVFFVPFTHEFIIVPLSQEYRIWHSLGESMTSVMTKHSDESVIGGLVSSLCGLLPVDPLANEGNGWITIAPQFMKPIVEIGQNQNFSGFNIYNDSDYSALEPEYQKVSYGTPSWMTKTSQFLNQITGGRRHRKGGLEEFEDEYLKPVGGSLLNNPSVWHHLLNGYLGGMYGTAAKAGGLAIDTYDWLAGNEDTSGKPAEAPKLGGVPILSRFMVKPTEKDATAKISDRGREIKDEADKIQNELSHLRKDRKGGDDEAKDEIKDIDREDRRMMKRTEKLYEKITKARSDYKNASDERHKERAKKRLEKYVEKYNDYVDGLEDDDE